MVLRVLGGQAKLVTKVDAFLDHVSESGLIFRSALEAYLAEDAEAFDRKMEQINKVEHLGDELRREIERYMYTKTLIPESRGDVLKLMESLDELLDSFHGALFYFDIEKPAFPQDVHRDLIALTACSVEAVEAVVLSARAFFKSLPNVSNHIHKVSFWESESDTLSTRLQRTVFADESLDLCHKMQLRDFARILAEIADKAEDVADSLGIYVIKRTL